MAIPPSPFLRNLDEKKLTWLIMGNKRRAGTVSIQK